MKKIISILMISIVCVSNFIGIFGTNKVKAVTAPMDKAEPYSKGEVVLFSYDGIGIGVEIQVYKKDGIEYPVYCLNKGKRGVEVGFEYTVDVNQMLSNQKIWRAIINGYPFKTPAELGCKTMEEAYAATKMAVYDAMYNYDLNKFDTYKHPETDKRTVQAIKKIITNARNSTETKIAATLNIKPEQNSWVVDEIDKQYVSKTYSVQASAVNKKYTIALSSSSDARFKITDVKNTEKTEFDTTEKFKVLIPIVDLEKSGEFTLTAKSDLKTMPIFYGESPNQDWQNYAVTVGEYEMADTSIKQNYQENKTQIEIQKQDGDTKIPLKNGTFNLLDENKQILYSELTTNDQGVIEVKHLLPGIYYLEEIKAPDGYYGYEDLIQIEVKLNQKTVVKVDNYKEQEEKPSEDPQEETEISVGEKKLPKTGF